MRLYERAVIIVCVIGIVGICLLGAAASLLGLTRLDNWCASQLQDV